MAHQQPEGGAAILAGAVDDGAVLAVAVRGQGQLADRLGPGRTAGHQGMVDLVHLAEFKGRGNDTVAVGVAREQQHA